MARTGGKLLADQLALHGCELAFCVPGESYLALLDGLYDHRDRLRVVTCRHEAAAANAAEASGKLTGRPGVCMVTRGPGATHAATGVHTARQDSTPLILLVGQVPRSERGREAFQEIDYEQVFGSMAKGAFEVDHADRIPELLAGAFTLAASDRQGPVVVAVPEDVLLSPATPPTPSLRRSPAGARRARHGRAEAVARGGRATLRPRGRRAVGRRGGRRVSAWARACGLPVGASFRRQDVVDKRSLLRGRRRAGVNPRLARRIREADLVLAVGTRLAEIETQGYTLLRAAGPPQTLVHVHPDPRELGRVYQPRLAVLERRALVRGGGGRDGARRGRALGRLGSRGAHRL